MNEIFRGRLVEAIIAESHAGFYGDDPDVLRASIGATLDELEPKAPVGLTEVIDALITNGYEAGPVAMITAVHKAVNGR